MDKLTERATNYAAEKTNELLAKAIARAYEDGYRDGYKDRAEKIDCAIDNTDIEYVDLGLPSGTRWSKEYLKDEKGFAAYYSQKFALYLRHNYKPKNFEYGKSE